MKTTSTYAQEMLAITDFVKKWRHYLIGNKFRISTYQKSLKHLLSQVFHTLEQLRWATKLYGFNYEIFYRPGNENHVAYALSQCHYEPLETPELHLLFMVSFSILVIITKLRQYFHAGTKGQAKVTKLTTNADNIHHFKFINDLIMFQNRIFITDKNGWHSKLLQE